MHYRRQNCILLDRMKSCMEKHVNERDDEAIKKMEGEDIIAQLLFLLQVFPYCVYISPHVLFEVYKNKTIF